MKKHIICEAHERLYKRIPTFTCEPGCTDCCGPVPFSKWEWERIKDKRKGDIKTLTCPYAVGGRCEIYEQRPLICRLFGAVDVETLRCPHGCGPERKLTKAEADEIMEEYFRILKMQEGET